MRSEVPTKILILKKCATLSPSPEYLSFLWYHTNKNLFSIIIFYKSSLLSFNMIYSLSLNIMYHLIQATTFESEIEGGLE